MNLIDLTNNGGFPLEQDALKFLQDAYGDMFASVAGIAGDKAILSGVQVVAGNVTNGWIVHNGEILRFQGAAVGPDVVIVEETAEATFEDGAVRPVYKTRYATVGSSGAFPFAQLRRVRLGSPLGAVEMWSGPVAGIPAPYALCDGSALDPAQYPDLFAVIGTTFGGDGIATFRLPDLRSRFIAGYSNADSDFNGIGKTGGAKQVALTLSQMPAHSHTRNAAGLAEHDMRINAPGGAGSLAGGSFHPATQVNTGSAGSGMPHENLPPFFTLAFIIKLK